jgi:hypothetical protein
MNRTELIAIVREHAAKSENYEAGWDIVVETYEDDEIAKVIGKVRTAEDAIMRMALAIAPYNERRREIEALADDDDYDPQMGTWSPALDKQPLCGETVDHVANSEDDSVCRRCGAELVYDNPVPETFVQDVVEAEAQEQFSRYPRNTETGPVCGNCTHYDGAGDRVVMRHATTHDVRDCYAARYDEEQAILGEIEAEKHVERRFEEGF